MAESLLPGTAKMKGCGEIGLVPEAEVTADKGREAATTPRTVGKRVCVWHS